MVSTRLIRMLSCTITPQMTGSLYSWLSSLYVKLCKGVKENGLENKQVGDKGDRQH